MSLEKNQIIEDHKNHIIENTKSESPPESAHASDIDQGNEAVLLRVDDAASNIKLAKDGHVRAASHMRNSHAERMN